VSDLHVTVCRDCGWRGFPERLWCPACGSDEVGTAVAASGVVAEGTSVRRAPGRELAEPVAVATVRLEGGGTAVARVEGGGGGEAAVSLDDGAPVARPGSAT